MNTVFPHNLTKQKAFTLIELLVVIAIITMLAAILFPVFGRARENARRSSCASNAKQIMLGVIQYIQDFDETHPPRDASGVGPWPYLIQPYLKSRQVFQCPSDQEDDLLSSNTNYNFHNSYLGHSVVDSASASALYAFFGKANSPAYIVRNASLVAPSGTVAIAEGGYDYNANVTPPLTAVKRSVLKPTAYIMFNPAETGMTAAAYGAPSDRHFDTTIVGFADGHVKAMKVDSFYYKNSPWLDRSRGGK